MRRACGPLWSEQPDWRTSVRRLEQGDLALTRILHLIAPAPYGGAESVVRTLAGAQRDAGSDVAVAAVVDPGVERDHPFVQSLHADGLEAFGLGIHPRGYLRERREVARVCRRFRPAVVHAHGARVVVTDAGAVHRAGARLVSTVHGLTGGHWRHRLYERLMIRSLRRYDAVVAVSTPIARVLGARGVPARRLTVLANACRRPAPLLGRQEARRLLGVPPEAVAIGWVGRFVPEKGADVLEAALKRLEWPNWWAVLVGDGPDWSAVRESIARAGLDARVRMPGAVPGAAQLFTAFDVFVLSSRTEGTPMALLEAMAAEIPIVATVVGGVPDVVTDAEAVLVPPEDPAALARAIELVCGDSVLAARKAAAARARFDTHHSVEVWREAYDRIYTAVLA